MKVKIYTGLSLSAATVQRHLPDAECAPPIQRGDLHRDIADGVHVVGLVDGVFYQQLAVSPAEIMDALRTGMIVYGASSMGALRAAELWPYGMIGCGGIFEHIRTTRFFRDDHLGQVITGGRTPSAGASMALVDLASVLEAVATRSRVDRGDVERLLRIYGKLHFSSRNLHELRRVAQSRGGDVARRLTAIVDLVEAAETRAKTDDALTMLRAIRDHRRAIERRRQSSRASGPRGERKRT